MERNEIIRKNVSLSIVFKFLNMLIVYLTIPYLLSFLGKESYGVWVTLFSIVNILFFVDAGIANGLKTKLSKAISINNIALAREYISTAYISISLIAVVFFVLSFLLLDFVNLNKLFNISNSIDKSILRDTFFITLVFVVANFVLSLYKTLYFSIQKAAIVEFTIFLYRFLAFILILYVGDTFSSSLRYVAYIYGLVSFIIGIIFTVAFFLKRTELTPHFKSFKKERLSDLMGLSINFFIIQLCLIIIFTTDNILISNLINPKEVTKYDIVLKLFQVLVTLSLIILEPFWALFSDAFQKKDFIWIKSTLKRLNKLFIILAVVTITLVFLTKPIIEFWIKEDLIIEDLLIISMGIFVLVRVYGLIYMYFLNGIGKINLQMRLYVFGAIINIPISILLVKYFNLGSSGIIIGTIISILANTIFLPIQSHRILNVT